MHVQQTNLETFLQKEKDFSFCPNVFNIFSFKEIFHILPVFNIACFRFVVCGNLLRLILIKNIVEKLKNNVDKSIESEQLQVYKI